MPSIRPIKMATFGFLLSCLTPFHLFATEHDKVVRLTSDPWCPYACDEHEDTPGYLIEIAEHVFTPAGYDVTITFLPWSRALKSTFQGKYDGAASAVRGNAGNNLIGKQSLGRDSTSVVMLKNAPNTFETLNDLDQLRIGVISDYTYDNHGQVDRYIAKRRANKDNITTIHSDEGAQLLLKMLKKGRIDAFFENQHVTYYNAKQLHLLDSIKTFPTGQGDDIFIAFTPNERGKKLMKIFDEGVATMKKNNHLKPILDKYGIPSID